MLTHYRRRLLALIALAASIVPIGIALSASQPAGALDPVPAHHAILEGVGSCSGAEHVIDWTIGNSVPKRDMQIMAASVALNGSTYTVDGYTNPVPGAGSTSATTTIPGALTGTATITVTGHWNDGHTTTRSADVALTDPCTVTTVPPTTNPTPTTTPTVTTGPPATTHSTTPPGSDIPPTATCRGVIQPDGTCKLAFTGPTIFGITPLQWGLLAALLIVAGLALFVMPERRRR